MKNIIILMLISILSMNSMAAGIFNIQIPQPDRITNSDYDGDGKVDSIDEDDDGDGILDENDSNPFGRPGGGSQTPAESGIETFSVNKNEIFLGESVTFNWSYTGDSNLTLFGGSLDSNGIDVTGLSTESDDPSESTTYSLYTDTGVSSVNVDVLPIPVVNSFTINGYSSNIKINKGESVSIAWNITGGKNVSISGGSLNNQTNLSNVGTIVDTPIESTIYTLFDGLNEISKNITVSNPCMFYSASDKSSHQWNYWTTVIKSAQNQYQFYVNGNQLSGWINSTSIPGYTIGKYMGTRGELGAGYSNDLTKMYEICTTN